MADFISGLLGMGEEDPMERAKQAGLLGLGATLLQAGAPSLTPTSLGAALGQGVMAGQQASGQAMQQARQQQIQKQMMGTMSGVSGGGDVQAKIAQLQKMALLDPKNQAAYLKIAEQMQGKTPTFTGEVANAALSLFGTADVSKLTSEQRGQAVQAVEQAKLRTAQASAPNVNVSYGRTFAQDLAGETIKDLSASNQAAQAAVSTLQTVSDIKPLLESGVYSGPGSSAQVLLAQIGQKLGVGGTDRAQVLQNTAVAMQGLAQLELQAASQLKGQGGLSEGERTILRRAAGGTLDKFTSQEILALVKTLEKTAKGRIGLHNAKVDQLMQMQPDAARMLTPLRVNPIPTGVVIQEVE